MASATSEIGQSIPRIVILWRSKERSDAAQTIGSMPRPQSVAAVQNSAPPRPLTTVTAWILGSSPRMTKAGGCRRANT
ncbi:MAG: hypothetical protein EOS56_22870 [Mesorhizobium sp.]|nr:MAG: hypothetical protein EOS56_22870 [Mesorhizobium sp.]RWC59336.1 MAG: hypothetical protein EOS29_22225 [Mesorhizobium sp.]